MPRVRARLMAAFETIQSRFNQILLCAIVSLGVVAGLIGIVAIASRLWEFGLTPNRLVVFISNILLIGTLGSLLWSMARNPSKDSTQTVRLSLNQSLPIFIAWAAVVTFLFPLLFGLPVLLGQ